MKTETKIIKCDFCKRILFFEENGKKEDFLKEQFTNVVLTNFEGKSVSGDVCSLPCLVLGMWATIRKTEPHTPDLVSSLSVILPNWKIEPPNYKEIYEEKVIKEAEEVLKKVGGYRVVKTSDNKEMNKPEK